MTRYIDGGDGIGPSLAHATGAAGDGVRSALALAAGTASTEGRAVRFAVIVVDLVVVEHVEQIVRLHLFNALIRIVLRNVVNFERLLSNCEKKN